MPGIIEATTAGDCWSFFCGSCLEENRFDVDREVVLVDNLLESKGTDGLSRYRSRDVNMFLSDLKADLLTSSGAKGDLEVWDDGALG